MEFLIPGLLLVALMVWASTKIKKNAAAAFEPETIETDDFTISKPEGFLHVLNDDSGLAFRSYSKEFGKAGKKDVRRGTAEVRVLSDTNLERRLKEIRKLADGVVSETKYVEGGKKTALIEVKVAEIEAAKNNTYKLVQSGKSVFELCVSILSEQREENSAKLETFVGGFDVK